MNERELFLSAREEPNPAARATFLAEACAGDLALRERVDQLLRADGNPDSLLDVPAVPPLDAEQTVCRADSQTDTARDQNTPGDVRRFLDPPNRTDSLGRIAHYEVLEVLGQGGFGIVFRAFDETLQRVVAVKVLSHQLATSSPARKRFLREARSSAKVRHENVVQVYAVEEQPLPFLVMEYIPGETLQERLDRTGPREAPEVVRIGRQIAEGLAAAHGTGLIHRDIKPANVLVERGPHERVKLTDFGLARAADDANMTQSGLVSGTPMFMSPEQARGEPLDARSDLFSLGSVLYAITSGRPPFRAANTYGVIKRVTEDAPRPIQDLIPETPDWLCEIIAKLHAKNPNDRYQSAREVADVLADCEAQLKTNSRLKDFSRIPRRKRASSGHWKWVAAAAVLIPVMALAATELAGVTHLIRGQPATPEKSPAAIAPVTDDAPPPRAASPAGQKKGPYLKKSLPGHAASVFAVVYSPDGRLLASGGNGDVRVFRDTETETLRYVLSDIRDLRFLAITFSPDSKYLLTAPQAGATPTSISIWEARSGKPVGVLEGHGKGLFDLSFSPDGKTLVSGGWEDFVRVWDFEERRKIRDIPSPTRHWLRSTVFSSKGQIAFGQDQVFLCESDGSQVRTINKHAGPLCFSPDGKRLAGTTWAAGFVTVWDVDTGNEIASWHAHKGTAEGVAFSRDGKVLATAGNDCTVRLWDYESQLQLAELPNEVGANGVAFSPDGITLATGGHDKLVKLWDVSAILAEQ